MPFEYPTKFSLVFRPPFEYLTGIQMVVWIPNYHLNTGHLNTGQVKVCYSDVSAIQVFVSQIPTVVVRFFGDGSKPDPKSHKLFLNQTILSSIWIVQLNKLIYTLFQTIYTLHPTFEKLFTGTKVQRNVQKISPLSVHEIDPWTLNQDFYAMASIACFCTNVVFCFFRPCSTFPTTCLIKLRSTKACVESWWVNLKRSCQKTLRKSRHF